MQNGTFTGVQFYEGMQGPQHFAGASKQLFVEKGLAKYVHDIGGLCSNDSSQVLLFEFAEILLHISHGIEGCLID